MAGSDHIRLQQSSLDVDVMVVQRFVACGQYLFEIPIVTFQPIIKFYKTTILIHYI